MSIQLARNTKIINLPSLQLPVLLVGDEPQLLQNTSQLVRSAGIRNILVLDDSREILSWLAERQIGMLVLDLTMPNLCGQDILTQITSDHPDVPVIVVTANNDIETAVRCMQLGALDYMVKPVDPNRLITSVKHALEIRALRYEVHSLSEHLLSGKLNHWQAFEEIITQNSQMHSIFHYIDAISPSRQPVLIMGETGVGKELFAKAIHSLSGDCGKWVEVNMGGLDDTMFSDTLFGHKKGAYTGAITDREGLIAQAKDGTLFLDEIGELQESSQVKLLRLLQEYTYYPLGSDQLRQSDARVIVATNRDIQTFVTQGKFRKDLYFRLRAHHIYIPPLRERLEDLPLLINHFLELAASSLQKKRPDPPPELLTLLKSYHFPGNVRELQTMIFDGVARHQRGTLSLKSFKDIIRQDIAVGSEHVMDATHDLTKLFPDRLPTLKESDRFLISEALKRSNGNQGIAATLLGISRQALNKRLLRSKNATGM